MSNNIIAKFGALTAAVLVIPSVSFAGTDAKEMKQVVEKCKESCITGDLGINIVSQYISRGVIFENQGAILEPYADLYFNLYKSDGFVSGVSLNLGIWNSFQSRHTDAGEASGNGKGNIGASSTRGWYEFDFTAGVAVTFAKNFTVTPSYFTFLSPNDGFSTFQGVNLKVSYDDTDLLGAFALHPYAQVLWELENKAGSGSDEGVYYEIGVAPSVPVGPVTLSFPLTLGLGSNEFYQANAGYGFFSAGINATYNLTCIPECYGKWSVNAGYTYYNLGNGTKDFNTQPANDVRDSSENEHVFSGGMMIAF